MHVELLAQVMHVILDRGRFDSQLATDLLVRQPAIDQLRDLQLAPRQSCTWDVTTGITVANGDSGASDARGTSGARVGGGGSAASSGTGTSGDTVANSD